jgi:AcrR family transcriptional regulator
MATTNNPRSEYRHGDLRNALIQAGLDHARISGTNGIVLREVTRAAGVVPNAAYRHFPNRLALIDAVSEAAQHLAAEAMRKEIASTENVNLSPNSWSRVDAIGRAYVGFAVAEPGLFDIAFNRPTGLGAALASGEDDLIVPAPLSVLLATLAQRPTRRSAGHEADYSDALAAWSAVHGLAMLLTSGSLAGAPAPIRAELTENVLRMVRSGLEHSEHAVPMTDGTGRQ